jgi:hypothetical protein
MRTQGKNLTRVQVWRKEKAKLGTMEGRSARFVCPPAVRAKWGNAVYIGFQEDIVLRWGQIENTRSRSGSRMQWGKQRNCGDNERDTGSSGFQIQTCVLHMKGMLRIPQQQHCVSRTHANSKFPNHDYEFKQLATVVSVSIRSQGY